MKILLMTKFSDLFVVITGMQNTSMSVWINYAKLLANAISDQLITYRLV